MKKYPIEAEARLTKEVPGFIRAVRSDKADIVITTLMAFNEDPMLLYMAIWFATTNGKSITFAEMTSAKGAKASPSPNSNKQDWQH